MKQKYTRYNLYNLSQYLSSTQNYSECFQNQCFHSPHEDLQTAVCSARKSNVRSAYLPNSTSQTVPW